MGNDRSSESQNNVWRHHILQYPKAGDAELETATRSKFKYKILCQFCLKALENNITFLDPQGQLLHSQWITQIEIQTHSSFYAYPCYLQE